MNNYRVYGTAKENNIAVSCLVVVYKAGRGGYLNTAGTELGRQVTGADGKFDIFYSDWNKSVFLVCLDLTESPQRYEGVILDWVRGEYVGSDPYWGKVVTMLHMDGTNAGTLFLDEVPANNYTAVGPAITSTGDKKFGASSLYLDGASRIQTPYLSSFNIGNKEFCFEAWVKLTQQSTAQIIYDCRTTGYAPLVIRADSGIVNVFMSSTGTNWITNLNPLSAATPLVLNAWTHIAVVRYNGIVTLYLNGAASASTSNSFTYMDGVGTHACIGGSVNSTEYWKGYIEEVRFTVGYSRYFSNFIPWSSKFPHSSGDSDFPYVKSLVHFDGSDNGAVFTDVIGNVITSSSGSPVTSVTDKKFGVSALKMVGTDILQVAHAPDMEVNNQDWTVETWVKSTIANSSAYRNIIDKRLNATGYGAFVIRTYAGYWEVYVRNGAAAWAYQTAAIVFTAGVWHHVALSRSLGKIRFFLDGVKVWDIAMTSNMVYDDYPLELGRSWIGYIDEFRYTVGVGRYVENFSVQTAPHPDL